MHARRIVLLLYFITVCLSVAIAKGYSDKRVQTGPSTFKTMVRYGRSSSTNSDQDVKPVNVYPRTDQKFYLMTRYGKRSAMSPNRSLVYPASTPLCGESEDLSCTWIGLSNLYRCTVRKDITTASN